MPDLDPPELGNEDEEWLALLEFAAAGGGTRACLCSHSAGDHWGSGECMHRACGCSVFRPGVNTSSTASRTGDFPAAGSDAA